MKSLTELVKIYKRQDLTAQDIEDATGRKILLFSELRKYKSLDDLLSKHGFVIILLQVNNQYNGHWVCLSKNDKTGVYRWADPYGISPFTEVKDYVPYDYKNFPDYIKELFERSSNIEYNKVDYQAKQPTISTCGRYAIVFSKLRNLSLNDIEVLFKTNNVAYLQDTDNVVTLLTMLWLGDLTK